MNTEEKILGLNEHEKLVWNIFKGFGCDCKSGEKN